jgi:hypothetical protein
MYYFNVKIANGGKLNIVIYCIWVSYTYMKRVTCIARQQTDKHLMAEYTHTTIELRMLFLVARQQSARQAASNINVTGFLCVA